MTHKPDTSPSLDPGGQSFLRDTVNTIILKYVWGVSQVKALHSGEWTV